MEQIKQFLAQYYISKDITYRKTSFDTHVQILMRKFHPRWFNACLQSRMEEQLIEYLPHTYLENDLNKKYNDEKYQFDDDSDSDPETPFDRNPATNGAVKYHILDVEHGENQVNED